MRLGSKMRLGLYATIALCLFLGPATGEDGVWLIGPRRLPPPGDASETLRNIVASKAQPKSKAFWAPAPANKEEWRGLIARSDEEGARSATTLAERAGVAIAEERLAGVRIYRLTPRAVAPEFDDRLFVHVHGGAFVLLGGRGGLHEAIFIAEKLGVRVVSIDYRRAPDFPAPAARDDVVSVWSELIQSMPAAKMALGGSSAGGNLTLVATRRILDLALPAPAAVMVGSPVVDLARNGDSRYLNEGVDGVLSWDAVTSGAMAIYANGRDYGEPDLSPIHADLNGFPPSYLISGTRDLLLSDTVLIHAKLRRAGVDADLHVYEGLGHVEYLHFLSTPESKQHFDELKSFLIKHFDTQARRRND